MIRDDKYQAVKSLIETKKIEQFEDIFKFLPKTKFAKDIGKHSDVIIRMLSNVNEVTVEIIEFLSDHLEVDVAIIYNLVHVQYRKQFKKDTKTPKEHRQVLKKK